MPIWSEILKELEQTSQQQGVRDFDKVRRKYLLELHKHTGRHAILYASGWLQKGGSQAATMSINDEDIQALMEVTQSVENSEIDLVLHSPGGSLEAAEAIVSYLRSRFDHIRVIVPNLAMSAATMIACAADEIALGKHSFLGPTDPQLLILTRFGPRFAAAQAILDQFDKAQKECKESQKLPAWLPMLGDYGPDLLAQCEAALDMSEELVMTWLQNYMFKEEPDASAKAKEISSWLAKHSNFKSHSRHIPRDDLEKHGMNIIRLEDDKKLQDTSLSVFHATTHTFTGTPAIKIVESHTGRAFIKQHIIAPSK